MSCVSGLWRWKVGGGPLSGRAAGSPATSVSGARAAAHQLHERHRSDTTPSRRPIQHGPARAAGDKTAQSPTGDGHGWSGRLPTLRDTRRMAS